LPGKAETVLILGGTREAAALAAELVAAHPDWRVITSLAGRTKEPKPVAGEVRIGGFGGAEGGGDGADDCHAPDDHGLKRKAGLVQNQRPFYIYVASCLLVVIFDDYWIMMVTYGPYSRGCLCLRRTRSKRQEVSFVDRRNMKSSFWGNFYRLFGLHIRANRADAESEERRLLVAEHLKPGNKRPRKVTYDEIMADLATGMPGRFLDRKVQAFMSGDLWPPISMSETFDKVEASGLDNAWTTSVQGGTRLLMISHPDIYQSMRLEFAPFRASFSVDGVEYSVRSRSSAMSVMMVHFAAGRIRFQNKDGNADVGEHVSVILQSL
jgi:Precorrin-6x reductase CbiJ/CobK